MKNDNFFRRMFRGFDRMIRPFDRSSKKGDGNFYLILYRRYDDGSSGVYRTFTNRKKAEEALRNIEHKDPFDAKYSLCVSRPYDEN